MALTQKLLDFMFDTRICPGCKIEKPARPEYFHRSKAYVCGYSYCKVCAAKDRDGRRERRRERDREYFWENREEKLAKNKIWMQENKKYRREYFKKRFNENPTLRLHRTLRSRLSCIIKSKGKSEKVVKYLGCTLEQLWEHLESQFAEGMTRENHGLYGWHIDHIRPLCSFPFEEHEEGSEEFEKLVYEACHYTNLQPLWAYDNLSKGGKYEPEKG